MRRNLKTSGEKLNPGRIPQEAAEAGPGFTWRTWQNGRRGVKSFSYSQEVVTGLELAFSPERLGTYVSAVPEGDTEQALRLYAWNVALSAAFYGMSQGLEVTLRNTMYRHLSAAHGPDWYDNPQVGLDDGGTRRIQDVKTRLARARHRRVSPEQVVAGLSLGFWVSLLGPRRPHRRSRTEGQTTK